MIYYLPSCNFKRLFPETSVKLQTWFAAKEGFTVAGCCKPSQKLFKEGDTVLNNCCSCAIITEEQSPQVESLSVYEYLLTDEAFPWPDLNGEHITVQDCFRARHHRQEQEAVREMLRRMNAVPVELEENFEKCTFDGVWLFSPKLPQEKFAPNTFGEINRHYITPVPEEEWEDRMKAHAALIQTERVAGYCNACITGLKMGGADAVHILQLAVQNL